MIQAAHNSSSLDRTEISSVQSRQCQAVNRCRRTLNAKNKDTLPVAIVFYVTFNEITTTQIQFHRGKRCSRALNCHIAANTISISEIKIATISNLIKKIANFLHSRAVSSRCEPHPRFFEIGSASTRRFSAKRTQLDSKY